MAPGVHTTKASRPSEGVDWLALFPSEHAPKPGPLEGPPVADPFELFPLERRLLDTPPVLPARQPRPVPRPAIRIVVEPIDPGWKLPEIHLSAPAWTMILTAVAMLLLIVFVRTRLPLLPDVAHIAAAEPARPIDVPSFALAAPKGVAAPRGATGQTLPIAPATALAARVPASSANPGDTSRRSADAIAPRSEPATAAVTPPATATFAADVSAGSPLTLEPARVAEIASATVVPVAFTPPPAPPPARVTDPSTVRVTDTAAIESVLGRYRSAFSALDPRDIQKVWPQVDRRVLERTFSEVDEQALQFDDCRIDITGRDARAACSGSARSLPKGSTRPKLESRRWDFTLSKIGTDWLILSAQTRR